MVCNFVIVFYILVSLDFKTLWKMFTQRGEYVAGATFAFFIENKVRVSQIILLSRAVKCNWEALVLASAFNLSINNISYNNGNFYHTHLAF